MGSGRNLVHRASHRGEFDESLQYIQPRGSRAHHVSSDSNSRTRHMTTSRNSMPLSDVNFYSQDGFHSSSSRFSMLDREPQREPAELQSHMGMELGYNGRNVSCMDRTHLAPKSCVGMNYKDDNNCIQQGQGSTTYLRGIEPCSQVFIDGYTEPRPRNMTKERDTESFKVEKSEQGSFFSNCMGISEGSATPMKRSIGTGEKDVSVMHQNISIRGIGSECSESYRGDVEKNTKTMSQILAPTFSSNFEVVCSQEKGLRTCSETRMVYESNNSQTDNKIQSITTGNSMKLSNDSVLDEQNKVAVAKTASIIPNKLWDGSLQLTSSIIVSTTAFFKSGEKGQDIKWPELVEVKGKVRLAPFEKFVQELPRSRTRTLMIISLCWQPNSSKAGLMGMKEIARGYKKNAKVGFAQICPGIDLYVCPHNETIITILTKYGFLKGMDASEDNQDSLIGCVVWRRSSQPSNSANNVLEKKESSVTDQTIHSPMSSIVEVNSSTKGQELTDKQATVSSTESGIAPRQLISQASSTSDNAKGLITEAKDNKMSKATCTNSSSKSTYGTWSSHSIYSTPLAPDAIPSQQKQESASSDETKQHSEKSKLIPENTTELDLFPSKLPSVICQPIHPFSAIMQSNFSYIGDSEKRATPLPNPPLPLNPPLPPGAPPYNLQTAKSSVHVAGNGQNVRVPMMHANELKEYSESSHINQIPLPRLPPLPTEVLQKKIEMQKTVVKEISGTGPFPTDSASNVSNAETPIKDVSAGVTVSSGIIPPEPALRQPQPRSSSSVAYHDIDDLPEFDFGSEIGPSDRSSTNPFLNIPLIKSRTLVESNNLKPVDGTPLSRASEKFLPQNKSMFQASQPQFQPSNTRSNSNIRKNRWDDDDDDMPEWCPPVQEQGVRLQISRSTGNPSLAHVNLRVATPPPPLIPSLAPSNFSCSEIQGSFGANQHTAPCISAVVHNRNALPTETAPAVRPSYSLQKHRNTPDADPSLKHNVSNLAGRPSFNSYKRTRRY